MYICRALLDHGYSAFSLAIIEYIDVTGLSKDSSKELILEREQFYINNLNPEFNLLKVAGSTLGFKHSEESIALIRDAKIGKNHPFMGKIIHLKLSRT
jgi:group I intron endonuclease